MMWKRSTLLAFCSLAMALSLGSCGSEQPEVATAPPTSEPEVAAPVALDEEFNVDFQGRVIRHGTDERLSNAVVTLISTGGRIGMTDDTGTAALSLKFPTGVPSLELLVTRAGYCNLTAVVKRSDLPPAGEFEFPMAAPIAVEGVVVDFEGQPVQGAAVKMTVDKKILRKGGLKDVESPGKLPQGWTYHLSERVDDATTGADGKFRFAAYPPWCARILVHAAHPTMGKVNLKVPIQAGPGEVERIEISLGAPQQRSSLRGRVTVNGEPNESSIKWFSKDSAGFGRTDEQGFYFMDGLPCGSLRIEAVPQLFADLDLARTLEGGVAEIELLPTGDQNHDIDLVVEEEVLEGTLSWPDGAPIQGARVTARSDSLRKLFEGKSNAEGLYTIRVPKTGMLYKVSVEHGPQSPERAGVPGGTTGVDFTVPAVGRLRFRVVDWDSGELLKAVEPYWVPSPGGGAMRLPNLSIAEDSNDEYNTPWIPVGTGSLVLRSDADGHLPWSQDGIKVLREAEPQTFEVELKRGLSIQFMLKAGSERLPLDKPILLLREDELPLVKRLGTSAWRAGPMFPGQSIVSSRQVLCQPPTAGRPAVPATIRALEPGTYHLATFAEGMQVTPETVEVAAGQAGPVELSWSME